MPVVNGLQKWAEAMSAHIDEYVLIGGGACSVVFDAEGADFRATKDLDIIVIAEECGPSFAKDFWAFIDAGGYTCGERRDGTTTYYRFELRTGDDATRSNGYPAQIELFSRHPRFNLKREGTNIAPLPFDDEVSSLSAIILNEGYYEFIKNNAEIVNGVSLLGPIALIPLKMRAHIDLQQKHASHGHCNKRDLRKHRTDVASLSALLTPLDRLELKGQMQADAELFLEDFAEYAQRNNRSNERARLMEDLALLKKVYL